MSKASYMFGGFDADEMFKIESEARINPKRVVQAYNLAKIKLEGSGEYLIVDRNKYGQNLRNADR